MKGCFRHLVLVLFTVIVVLAVALAVLLLREQGILSIFNATYQNQGTLVLNSVQQMSKLTTTRYNFSSMITSQREIPDLLASLYGERQVLVAVGSVTAGIDLSQMSPEDITFQGSTISLTLPPPVLQDCFLDENASYVAQRDTGVFARSAPELEGQARQYAVRQFRDGALQSGILEAVQQHAVEAISRFVELLPLPGVTSVRVQTTPPDLNAPLPLTCQ